MLSINNRKARAASISGARTCQNRSAAWVATSLKRWYSSYWMTKSLCSVSPTEAGPRLPSGSTFATVRSRLAKECLWRAQAVRVFAGSVPDSCLPDQERAGPGLAILLK